jgi:tryptophanyl-tRNA synthetase
MSLDDPSQKMSKSAARPASSILLLDPPEVISKKCKSAVTDSGNEIKAGEDKPALTNLLTIFALVGDTSVGELERRFEGKGYGDLKVALGEAVGERLRPIRERYAGFMDDPGETDRLLRRGAEKASEVAAGTMTKVRSAVGLSS